ncbi:unnamed protein product, partial [Closterium sp. Naga37s-1]
GKQQKRGENGFVSLMEIDGQPTTPPPVGESIATESGLVVTKIAEAKEGPFDVDQFQVRVTGLGELDVRVRVAHPLLQTPEEAETHFNVELSDVKMTSAVHGVLGQTFRNTPEQLKRAVKYSMLATLLHHPVDVDKAEGKGFLDGEVEDYITSSIVAPDCKYLVAVAQRMGKEEIGLAAATSPCCSRRGRREGGVFDLSIKALMRLEEGGASRRCTVFPPTSFSIHSQPLTPMSLLPMPPCVSVLVCMRGEEGCSTSASRRCTIFPHPSQYIYTPSHPCPFPPCPHASLCGFQRGGGVYIPSSYSTHILPPLSTTPMPLSPTPMSLSPTPMSLSPTPMSLSPTPMSLSPTPMSLSPTPMSLSPTPMSLSPTPMPLSPTPMPLSPTPMSLSPKPHVPMYGQEGSGLVLDLVYNPISAFNPAAVGNVVCPYLMAVPRVSLSAAVSPTPSPASLPAPVQISAFNPAAAGNVMFLHLMAVPQVSLSAAFSPTPSPASLLTNTDCCLQPSSSGKSDVPKPD